MADAVVVTPRPIYMEDLDVTLLPSGDTTTQFVLGAGNVSVTRIPMKLLQQLVIAANDAAAAGLGVLIGQCYYNSTHTALWTRMT